MNKLSAIPIKTPFIDMILIGVKTWEIRTKSTKKIGPVALIRSGSGTVVSTAFLAEDIFLTRKICAANYEKMGMTKEEALTCYGEHAWVLKDIIKLRKPVPYKHPPGAITWVTLDEPTTKKVLKEASKSERVY
jgi:hypothetical protein